MTDEQRQPAEPEPEDRPIWIGESFINGTRGLRMGDSGLYETQFTDKGELYRSLVKEHGRCTGRVYVDRKDGSTLSIGWVFVKRQKYSDCEDTYLAETWVSLHSGPDTVTRVQNYLSLPTLGSKV